MSHFQPGRLKLVAGWISEVGMISSHGVSLLPFLRIYVAEKSLIPYLSSELEFSRVQPSGVVSSMLMSTSFVTSMRPISMSVWVPLLDL